MANSVHLQTVQNAELHPSFIVGENEISEHLKMATFVDEHQENEWVCPICQTLVFDPMSCYNCEPLYCKGCLIKIKQPKCPTCNMDKNFTTINLKLKNMLMELKLKGCPVSPDCQFYNEPMSYQ